MTRSSAFLTSIVGLVTATAFIAMGADWPQWRGENRAAKVTDFKAPETWPKELTQKWKTAVGDGDATPSLAGDKLYVFAMEDGNEVLRCLNAASGQELWQDKYEAQGADGPARGHAGPRASPTVVEGKVVTLGVRGMLSCVDAESGKVLWRKDDFQSAPSFFTSSSPIIVDGLCIAQLGGQRGGGGVVAYALASGEEKWKWTGDSPAYASPALMTLDGSKFIVAITAGKLVALAASSGELAWETPVGGGGGRGRGGQGGGRRGGPDGAGQKRGDGGDGEKRGPAAETTQQEPGQKKGEGGRGRGGRGGGGMGAGGRYNASTPVVDGQTIYYVLPGGMKAVKLDKEGDKVVGKEVWSNTETTIEYNTPVLKDGLLFGLTAANRFFCVNAETGKAAWIGPGGQASGGGRGGQGGYGSVVDAGAVLLAITPGSELVVIEPTDKEYKELARIKVADSPTYAHLVVAGNRLFVKDKDSVAMLTVD